MYSAGDSLQALDAEMDEELTFVGIGEVVYAQATTVLTRQIAWRQAAQRLVTEKLQIVIFMSEVLNKKYESQSTEMTRNVADDIVGGLRQSSASKDAILGYAVGKLSVEVLNAVF